MKFCKDMKIVTKILDFILSNMERRRVIKMFNAGMQIREMSKKLLLSECAIFKIIEKYETQSI